MKVIIRYFFVSSLIGLMAFGPGPLSEPIPDATAAIVQDSIISPGEIGTYQLNDLIIECTDSNRDELKSDLQYYLSEWSNVSSPLVVYYRGTDIGDYFHMEFEDAAGNFYDFGFGNNNYSGYNLFDEDFMEEDNPEYLNKRFKVDWAWKISLFPCCSGEYDFVKAYQPSILQMSLMDE